MSRLVSKMFSISLLAQLFTKKIHESWRTPDYCNKTPVITTWILILLHCAKEIIGISEKNNEYPISFIALSARSGYNRYQIFFFLSVVLVPSP